MEKTVVVSLEENATYFVKEGKLVKVADLPKGYGTQTIVWKDGKPKCVDIQFTETV
ncbi:hypothetical protein [Sporosarcina sp. FSL W7-1283]|uniref:hypothetical protein n=1 Tax=Sporosarcina sp. FSL W7-1283 TaxID=2921560 RepID=UPI0030F6D457